MQLAFGLSRGVPEDVKTAWGARLIAPNDLVHDRQDLVAESDESKLELIAWLNGGAIQGALDLLRDCRFTIPDGEQFVAYEDERGVIVANTNNSGGYLYTAGWLKVDTRERFELVRGAIPAERWEKAYGWPREQALKMDGTSTEVRLYHIAADGEKREIGVNVDSGFEFGYGGTGPHTSAAAIVKATLTDSPLSSARLHELVPEVFRVTAAGRVTVYAEDILERIGVLAHA